MSDKTPEKDSFEEFFKPTKAGEFSGKYKWLGVRYKVTPMSIMILMEKKQFWFLGDVIEIYLRLVRLSKNISYLRRS